MRLKPHNNMCDELQFQSGKDIYANHGIVGINHHLQPTEGYDGTIDDDKLTKAERRELALYAISLWEAYIAKNTE